MSKIYIVKAPQGDYESYKEPIVKVFLNKKKATQYVKDENAKLPLEQAKKCQDCQWKWEMCFTRTQTEPICYKPGKYVNCENFFKYHDIQELFMEEYEVEDE